MCHAEFFQDVSSSSVETPRRITHSERVFTHFVLLCVSAFLNLFIFLRFFSSLIRRVTFNRHSCSYKYEMHQFSHHSLTFNSSSIVPNFGLIYFVAFCGLWPSIVRVSSESKSNFAISVSLDFACRIADVSARRITVDGLSTVEICLCLRELVS